MEFYIGTICVFGFQFAPRNWAYCNGSLRPIASNTALFSLLGTTYGGDGRTTFGLPNLQGRSAIDQGQLAGGSLYTMGETAGTQSVTILTSNMPAHAHSVTFAINADARDTGSSDSPQGNYPALSTSNIYGGPPATTNVFMKPPVITLGNSGAQMPIGISDPSLVMNYCICQYGIFPSRN